MLNRVALGLNIISLIVNIAVLATPYWQYLAIGERNGYYGLWQSCSGPYPFVDQCATFREVSDALWAIRALELLGTIIILGALVCSALSLSVMKSQTLLPKVAGGCSIAAAAFMIIGATTYAVKEKIDYQYLGISIKCPCLYIGFTFCIVAGVLAIVAGILYLIKKND